MTKNRISIKSHDDVFEAIAKSIDITPVLFEKATKRYESIGSWLDRDNSELAGRNPEIYPQGSFALGTVIKPTTDDDDYDIDLVCKVDGSKNILTQEALKILVGKEVKSYAVANSMNNKPQEGRRCWTIQYAESAHFHMDILPSIPDTIAFHERLIESGYQPDAEVTGHALAITDNSLPNYSVISSDWNQSNPKGYAFWFHLQMLEELMRKKKEYIINEGIRASVDDVPNHRVKTTLQRTIQLLKRHRDNFFENDDQFEVEDKPISIIITTLAARSYGNETSISEALRNILNGMDQHIQVRKGTYWVVNPVNQTENFADKWDETKRRAFEKWLAEARKDFSTYMYGSAFDKMPNTTKERLGANIVENTLSAIGFGAVPLQSPEILASRTKEALKHAKQIHAPTKPWLPIY